MSKTKPKKVLESYKTCSQQNSALMKSKESQNSFLTRNNSNRTNLVEAYHELRYGPTRIGDAMELKQSEIVRSRNQYL